jgi:hypothetical protein
MEEKIYCGSGPLPKGHRYGSMQECLDKGQVKLWGLKKVDPRIMEATKLNKKNKKVVKLDDLRIVQVSLRGKIKRKTNEHKSEKNEKVKNTLMKEIEELKVKLALANEQAKELEKERDAKKGSKKGTKKASVKKASVKKASRKASVKKASRKTSVKKASKKAPVKKMPARKTSKKTKK